MNLIFFLLQTFQDSQEALFLDENNLKAKYLHAISSIELGKKDKDLIKISNGIERLILCNRFKILKTNKDFGLSSLMSSFNLLKEIK